MQVPTRRQPPLHNRRLHHPHHSNRQLQTVTLLLGHDERQTMTKYSIISASYRVCQCQDTNSRAGAFTAYKQQYTMLRDEAAGHARPNPCQQILTDIQALIDSKRKKGYRSILMLDTNGDIHQQKKTDIGMQEFIQRTNLIDAYHQKFHYSPFTYMWGTKRLGYILRRPNPGTID